MESAPWTPERIRRHAPADAFDRAWDIAAAGSVEAPSRFGSVLLSTVRTDRRYEVLVLLPTGVSECTCDTKALLPRTLFCEHVAAVLLAHLHPDKARAASARPRRETVVGIAGADGHHLRIEANALRPDLRAIVLTFRPYLRRETLEYLVPANAEANLTRELTLRGVDLRVVREPTRPRLLAASEDGGLVVRIDPIETEGMPRAQHEAESQLRAAGATWSGSDLGYRIPQSAWRSLEGPLSGLGFTVLTEPPGADDGTRSRRPRPPAAPPREALTLPQRAEPPPRSVVISATAEGFELAPAEGRGVPGNLHSTLRALGYQDAAPERWRGGVEGIAAVASLLHLRGIEVRGIPHGGPWEGLRIHFHQREATAPVALRFVGATPEVREAAARACTEEGEAHPLIREDPEGVWVADEAAAFGRFLRRALHEGALPTVNPGLRTQPLERIIVLVDQGCLPPRLTEWRSLKEPGTKKRAVVSAVLQKAMESLIPEGWEEDKERGHLFLPSARAGHIVETLRDLGADVQYRKLAPAKEQFREWPEWLPEDETGARPVRREPWRGTLERPIPGLRSSARLDEHQREGVAFILHHGHTCLLADEMGLGKTLQAIASAQFLPGRILVVCPASARSVWENEVAKWTEEETVVLAPGSDPALVENSKGSAKYVIVAYSGLQRFVPHLPPEDFDLVVLDESHYIKNKRAKRTRAITEHLVKVPRRLILSGTPVMNSPEEVRAQLAFLHPGEWSDEAWFRRRFVDPYHGGTPEVKEAILAALREYLEGVMLRREKRHALPDLPDKRFRVHRLELTPEARRAYDQEEDGFRVYLREHEDSALAQDFATTSGHLERLKQAALVAKLPDVLAFLKEHLESGEKVVVFTKYLDPIKALAKELKSYGVVTLTGSTAPAKRAEAVRAFQEDDTAQVFIGQIIAAGTAITLTRAAHCVFLDLDWNPANHRQAMDRLHRKGQEREVTVHFFLAERTVDDDIAEVLEEKAQMMDLLLEGRRQGSFGIREERGLQSDVALRVLQRA